MLAKIDASREIFVANGLIRKYGETKIIPVKFGNTGSTNTKFHLKQVGYSYINSGYQWPNYTKIETVNPSLAKLIKILKQEMMHEQVDYTETGRVTFKHPIGKNNDLVHGWELSLDAVMEFQQKNLGYEKRTIEPQLYPNAMVEAWRNREIEEEEDDIYDVPIYDRPRRSDSLISDDF